MEIEGNSTNCFYCHKPLVWISRVKRSQQGRDVYEFDFRCDSCKREFQFKDGKLKELKAQRDAFAELMAMREAEIGAIRNRRCPHCGGPLNDWLTCDWCHEQYGIDNGELVPRTEILLKQRKPQMREFYALNAQR